MKKYNNVLWGIILIIAGIVIGGKILGIFTFDLFFSGWWTLFIIIPCIIGIFNEKDKTAYILGLFVGIALLLWCQGIISLTIIFKLAFPVTLILLGVALIVNEATDGKKKYDLTDLFKKDKK